MPTFSDVVAITNSATADAKSAGSTIDIQPNVTITEIKVTSITLGNTYGVEIAYPNGPSPLRFLVPTNGAPATNGQAIHAAEPIKVRIPVVGVSRVTIYTYADTASATCKVSLKWETGVASQVTYGDFLTASVGTTEASAGSINVPSGATLKQITTASRLSIGVLQTVRLYFSGIVTPQTYMVCSALYDAVGTEVQDNAGGIQPVEPIEIDVAIPDSANSVTLYALSGTASNTMAIGLVWV